MAENFNGTAPVNTEALLKMADEGLANIENELKNSKEKKNSIGILKNHSQANLTTLEKIRQKAAQ